jgi:(p)ppGpp synthase/HD superfamily hydrolase
MIPFTERLHEALDFAAIQHAKQKRKDADINIPYISHLFGVAYILAQHGFGEDVVVSGVLHDFIEDIVEKKHKPILEQELTRRFGENVHRLVRFVTQQKRDERGKRIAWHARGEAYRKLLCDPTTPNEARAISCADKIHNIESLLMALRREEGKGGKLWRRMKATPADQLEKFHLLQVGLAACWTHPIVDEFGRKVGELTTLMTSGRNLVHTRP